MCVFSSNNGFIIENIIKTNNSFDWYKLIDKNSGSLREFISKTISNNCENTEIEDLFSEIVGMRNRIIHGFRVTSSNGEQILATKTPEKDGNVQFEITEEYLMDFITKNDKLAELLHQYRGY